MSGLQEQDGHPPSKGLAHVQPDPACQNPLAVPLSVKREEHYAATHSAFEKLCTPLRIGQVLLSDQRSLFWPPGPHDSWQKTANPPWP